MKYIVIIAVVLISLISSEYIFSKPYGLRKSNKIIQWNGDLEYNYHVVMREPYTQVLLKPEITFGTINLGFGLYVPFSMNSDIELRTIEWNSYQAFLGKIYYLQYGYEKTSPVSFKISPIESYTLGHGLILHRYTNELFFSEMRKIGSQFNINISGIQLNVIIGDISTTAPIGGRISFHSKELFGIKNGILSGLELGFTLVTDIEPKKRDVVQERSRYDHKIIQKSSSSNSVIIYGIDFSMMLIQSNWIQLGLYTEVAKINISGEGLGYGIIGQLFPNSAKINYKFQFRHLFNHFTPSYINSYYDAYRSFKIDTINNQNGKYGWFIELSRYFNNNKAGIVIAYDEVFNGSYNPHLYILLFAHEIFNKKMNFTMKYDRFNFTKTTHLVNVENIHSIFQIELLYQFTKFIEFGFSYQKGFYIEDRDSEELEKLTNITVFTKILF